MGKYLVIFNCQMTLDGDGSEYDDKIKRIVAQLNEMGFEVVEWEDYEA